MSGWIDRQKDKWKHKWIDGQTERLIDRMKKCTLNIIFHICQTLYEAVCSDRNLYSKQLIEARDEITEMKRKLKILSHQIDQLKEEIASKVNYSLYTILMYCSITVYGK